jgi:hypothetical protein
MLIYCFILFIFTSFQQDPLYDYRWKNRLLLIYANNQEAISKQKNALDHQKEQVKERDLKIIFLEDFDIEEKAYLKKKFTLVDTFTIVLIGKDGGMKLKKKEFVEPQLIFDLIDTMPMRQAEMKKSK